MGASQGIGRGVAARAGSRGRTGRVRVALDARLSRRPPRRSQGPAAVFAADTDDLDRAREAPRRGRGRAGPIEILVTNTGGPPPGGALDHSLEEWEAAYRSLVLAPRVLIEAVLPGMRERGWGRIVNVGSTSTHRADPGPRAFERPPDGGDRASSRRSHREVAGDGITVNTIATGRFATERLADDSGSLEPAHEAREARRPRRAPRPPRGVRRPRRVPASERAAYLTGAVIPLDGGALRSA